MLNSNQAEVLKEMKCLIVDDDSELRFIIRRHLNHVVGQMEEASNGVEALEKIKDQHYDIVLLDVDMPLMSGIEALHKIKKQNPATVVVMMTAFADLQDAVYCVKEGAFDYLEKPILKESLIDLLSKAVEANALIQKVVATAPLFIDNGKKMIGGSDSMKRVFDVIMRLSRVDTPVLVRGASGTGKELVAKAIHFNSSRKSNRFVAVNCSAIPDTLFESEFFGHEKGAFTGAEERKIGKFQFANGGTLFLDEVGDLSTLMQVKLLRVLQEKVFTPVGSNQEIEVDVRIVAATNRPLEEMMKEGSFRSDLYYRLNVMPIFLPELKNRVEDIGHLVELFIKKFNLEHKKSIEKVSPDAQGILKSYPWPGNIRELENVIEHAFIWSEGTTIESGHLPVGLLRSSSQETDLDGNLQIQDSAIHIQEDQQVPKETHVVIQGEDLEFSKQKEQFEIAFIRKALRLNKGKVNQTALQAQIPKKTLLRKLQKYEINPRDYFDNP